MSSAVEARELRQQAAHSAPHSAERVDLLERAARLADSAGDTALGYAVRGDLIRAAVFAGEPERAMVAFAWCLALCDERPEEYPEADLHWEYKWMALLVPGFAEISREQVCALLDDIDARFRRRGLGERAVLNLRALAAVELGDHADVERYFEAWKRSSRDALSDCLACELSQEIGLLIRLGRDDEAIDKMRRLLESRRRCVEVPAHTYAVVQVALLRKHDLATAMAYQRKGYPLLKRLRKEGADRVGDHLAVLAVAHELGRGLRILRESMPLAAEHSAGFSRLRFLVGAQVLLQRASAHQEKASLVVPKAFGGSGESQQHRLVSVAALFAEQARTLAGLFDRRNGNDSTSHWAEERLALAALELAPLPD